MGADSGVSMAPSRRKGNEAETTPDGEENSGSGRSALDEWADTSGAQCNMFSATSNKLAEKLRGHNVRCWNAIMKEKECPQTVCLRRMNYFSFLHIQFSEGVQFTKIMHSLDSAQEVNGIMA